MPSKRCLLFQRCWDSDFVSTWNATYFFTLQWRSLLQKCHLVSQPISSWTAGVLLQSSWLVRVRWHIFCFYFLRALSIHQKLSIWGSIGWRLCSIWKIYHASIIDELIISEIHFRISKFLKTSFSKWPIANACKDSFFGRQSQQTLQVIAEYFRFKSLQYTQFV